MRSALPGARTRTSWGVLSTPSTSAVLTMPSRPTTSVSSTLRPPTLRMTEISPLSGK